MSEEVYPFYLHLSCWVAYFRGNFVIRSYSGVKKCENC